MVTIKDVAKRANVAPSTVSRVISNNDAISEKTAQKVRQIMYEMGYIPNVSARRLVKKQSNTIGILLKSSSKEMRQNPFFTDVLMSISKICKNSGYSTVISTSADEAELLVEVKELISGNAVDGFIVLYSKEEDRVRHYLRENNCPFVIIGKQLNDADDIYIDNDNVEASKQLTEYLISLGHRHIAFIAENKTYAVNIDRLQGYRTACKNAGIALSTYEGAAGTDDVRQIIRSLPADITALITSDSMMNLNVLSELYLAGRRIPADIQTATFNDSYLNETACPPQTVVDIFPERLGEEAASRLIEYLCHRDMLKVSKMIPTRIIERQSTKPLKEWDE
ncbi:LacI family transcriptional regulator [Macrococcus hajekii]|uniref:LacI family transcriptional regulator n=1 Tax=Macrococcus hajekii TaxID=198482 RepID=A0A4R6BJI8_9STAP|nr:LacI family DNA-binding transcriptional regulator [Macrococcus hajekii]TDM01873.1 LacI family transcriptional regulator [Macrococcus hajekii]GGB08197.1 LacI family transcriptional regulator [Macrococcus hajekii]